MTKIISDNLANKKNAVKLPLPTHPYIQQSTTKIRLEIQGLRGTSVLAILLFHMWEQTFYNGYLGVDVFFIISGFLMAHILQKHKLTLPLVVDFYFRRLKRILPLYLLMILVVLLISTQLVHPFEFAQLIGETFPSIFFYNNWPPLRQHGYFDVRTNNYYFTHTWSLCVEFQFYLIVPFFIIILQFLNNIHLFFAIFIILYIQCLSLWRQIHGYPGADAKHMLTDARLWQFLSGFLAYEIEKRWNQWSNTHQQQNSSKNQFLLTALKITKFGLSLILIAILFLDVKIENQQFLRFLTTLVTALILSTSIKNQVLTFEPLVKLGNWSYSIYLFHWPLFVLHRYLHPHKYDMDLLAGKETSMKFALPLLISACLIGILFEELYKRLQRYLRSWISLLSLIGFLYFCIGTLIVYLGQTMMWPYDSTSPVTPEWTQQAEQDIQMLWETREQGIKISHQEALQMNREIAKYDNLIAHCSQNKSAPTSFPFTYMDNTYVCVDQGVGDKNIVVIGNSHALFSHTGIKYHFRDKYANLTIFVATACMFATIDQQLSIAREMCRSYLNELVPALRQWKHRIDIIMVFFGYARFPDQPIKTQIKNDQMFQFMQGLYTNLSEIVQDVVFVSNVSLTFWDDQNKIVQKRLRDGKDLNGIGTTVEKQLKFLPKVRERMRNLQCKNCITVDFLRLWCPDGQFCSSVDHLNQMALFSDYHHVSAYGSMFLGKYMRELYGNQTTIMNNRSNALI